MTPAVVDSSVVVKWFVPEPFSAEAIRLRDGGCPLHAPDFLDLEVGNVLWKNVQRGQLARPDAVAILLLLPQLPITRHALGPLVPPAFTIADQTARTVYDCLYVALAVQLGGAMVTADDRLVNALSGTSWSANVARLQDVP